MKTKRLLSLCVLGLVLTTFVAAVSAAEFYGIVDSFGKKPRNAYLDVSVDTTVSSGPVDVSFNVYNAQGGQVGLFSLTTNGNGFVSTTSFANLFNLTGGWTVPQILIGDRPIGGYSELRQLDRDGRLDDLLAA